MVSSVFAQDESNSIIMTSLLSATFAVLSRLDRIRLRLVWFVLFLLLFVVSVTTVFVPHFSFQTSIRSLSPINPSKFGACGEVTRAFSILNFSKQSGKPKI